MKRILLATAATFGLAAAAHASPVSIVQLAQTSSGNTVTATNNAALTGATGATTITISNQTVNISQLLGNATPINGVFENLSAVSTDNAVAMMGGIFQNFNGNFCVSSAANCGGTVFLSGNFTDAAFGVAGGSQLSLNVASPPDTLNLSSAVIPANRLVGPSSLTFGFTSLGPTPPGLTIGANHSINGFTASFTENASASVAAVPEPTTTALLGVGLLGLGFIRRRSN